jgi:septum formation protein
MNTLLNWYDRPIILASQSPRRKEILDMIALPYKIHIPEYEENNSSQDIPSQIVLKHALHKAQAVAPFYTKAWIIGADTIVVCDNQILGKPKNESDATRMLQTLSGVEHSVFTGYCVLNSANGRYLENVVETKVTFKTIALSDIRHYVRNYHPFDKAGAYAIQDFSAVFVEKINGCFYNVVGFPLPAFYEQIRTSLQTCL